MSKHYIIDGKVFNAAPDRTQISTRQAMMIITPAFTAAGVHVDELSLSRASFVQAQYGSYEVVAAEVRQNFQPTVPLVAHSTGKVGTFKWNQSQFFSDCCIWFRR